MSAENPNIPSDNLSQATRGILLAAATYSQGAKHDYVGTEHLLYALYEDAGVVDILTRLGANKDAAKIALDSHETPGDKTVTLVTALTPRTKMVFAYARRFREFAGRQLVEPQDIVLGIMAESNNRENKGIAAQVLESFGINLANLSSAFGIPDYSGFF